MQAVMRRAHFDVVREFSRRLCGISAKTAIIFGLGINLAACSSKQELPPLPPVADMCALYSSYRYSAPAAAVEAPDALDKHNANERVFYDRCITNSPKLDPERKGGPR